MCRHCRPRVTDTEHWVEVKSNVNGKVKRFVKYTDLCAFVLSDLACSSTAGSRARGRGYVKVDSYTILAFYCSCITKSKNIRVL